MGYEGFVSWAWMGLRIPKADKRAVAARRPIRIRFTSVPHRTVARPFGGTKVPPLRKAAASHLIRRPAQRVSRLKSFRSFAEVTMRSVTATKRVLGCVVFLAAVGWASLAHAQTFVGTWVRTDAVGKGITMTVETCCNGGLRLIYLVPGAGGQPAMTMTLDSPMDGTEAPTMIAGKPTGQTMAIKRVDDRHYSAVGKMGGTPIGTYNGTISPDGKTMTVESTMQVAPGGKAEKIIETWVRK